MFSTFRVLTKTPATGANTVDLNEFLIFLYIQLYRPPQRLVLGSDYPSNPHGSYEERLYHDFVMNTLPLALELVSTAGSISRREFCSLAFLLACGPSEIAELTPLSKGAPFFHGHAEQESSDRVVEYLRANLVVNTSLYPFIAYRQEPPNQDEIDHVYTFANTPRDICVPPAGAAIEARAVPLIYSDIVRKTMIFVSGPSLTDPLRSLKVIRCKHGFLYCLSPFENVTIYGCKNLTIVVGAVAKCVRMQRCVDVRVVVVTRMVVLKSCVSCTLNLYSALPPLFRGKHSEISLAPYNTHYGLLKEHLEAARLSPKQEPSMWLKPIMIAPKAPSRGRSPSFTAHGDAAAATQDLPWAILPPSKFTEFVVPVMVEGSTKRNPIPLLAKYKAALMQNRDLVTQLHAQMQALEPPASGGRCQEIVHARFSEWVRTSGHIREVRQLMTVNKLEIGDDLGTDTPRSGSVGLPPSTNSEGDQSPRTSRSGSTL
eukprot:c33987_g1_i1.p1 GENE.c33987_g1_i1~~c33987_g1_i1.p1  ORF type:complete len:567 (+),score=100.02 c33987_g1_i1:249-1703(+)